MVQAEKTRLNIEPRWWPPQIEFVLISGLISGFILLGVWRPMPPLVLFALSIGLMVLAAFLIAWRSFLIPPILILFLSSGQVALPLGAKSPSIPIVDLAFLCTGMLGMLAVLWTNYGQKRAFQAAGGHTLNSLTIATVLYILTCIPSVLGSQDLAISLLRLKIIVVGLMALWTIIIYCPPKHIQHALYALLISLGIVAIKLILVVLNLGFRNALLYRLTDIPEIGRSNFVGALLLPAVFVGLGLFGKERRLLYKGLLLSYIIVVLFAIVLTLSRGALMALLIGIVLWGLQNRKFKLWLLFIPFLLTILVTGPAWEYLMLRITQRGLFGTNSRLELWIEAWKTFLSAPWFGVGLGVRLLLPRLSDQRYDPHNFVLGALMETGILGTLGLSGLLALTFAQIRRAYRSAKQDPIIQALHITLLTMLLSSLIEPTFRSGLYTSLFWILVGLLIKTSTSQT